MARGNSSLSHVVNKYGIVFYDTDHATCYDAILNQNICAPTYLVEEMLATLHLFDDLKILLGRLGWVKFVNLQDSVYEWLVWEFMSSLVVDLKR